ncbi:hypothetical protein [Apibacter adventoris]|uniref:Uncharacterized protein n=1 Tax=Apibacter adventoris TaxID=1679466 RepID=A0A2S8A7M1_9FLAO|nr:hypothetical protein [Apibacter adventoris]PQL90565.1 hypothetical protein C4S77_11845 [Apibacter adventoris]
MKMKVIVNFFIIITFIYSCQGQNRKENENRSIKTQMKNTDMKLVEEVLKAQLCRGTGDRGMECDEPIINSDEEFFKASYIIIDSILLKNGYIKIENDKFYNRIKLIFGDYLFKKFETKNIIHFDLNLVENAKCSTFPPSFTESDSYYLYTEGSEKTGYHIVKDKQIISNFYYLPELIDYQKEYPKIAQLEDKKYKNYNFNQLASLQIAFWKDDKDLPKERRFNQQLLISRNKYLFNDDKSQFAWLINNDEDFMQSLVTTFGYTEDKKLLKWAFEKQGFSNYQKYPPDNIMENYGKFLWTKQCNGEINLHPNTLYLIKELSEPSINKDKYLLNLAEYINYLVNNEKETELNLQQKAKIAAYLLAFGEQYKYNKEYGYNQMFLGKFIFYQDPDKKYKKEFEKNNYYNLPNLKKWYQQAEQEKDMFENDQTLADDPQPKDYVYRATYYKGPYSK